MKKKLRLELIDEYIKLYSVLFSCKKLVLEGLNKQMDALFEYSKFSICLKKKYEDTFSRFGVIDDAFYLLKKQLDNTILQVHNHTTITNEINLGEIWQKLIEIEKTHNNILNKLKCNTI